MTKIAVIPIYGKKKYKNKSLCPVTILIDSQVSDRCPWATCLKTIAARDLKSGRSKTSNESM